MSLYTVWEDYYATGEGRTIMVWVGTAQDEAEARKEFTRAFGNYLGQHPDGVAEGIPENEHVNYLLPENVRKNILEYHMRGAYISFHVEHHFNFA